ncbi:MAG: hypothetical protein JW995_00735 [Melioribacteraceae bacterium]|nr:hypothetical protein [Melioribacteraceae bacterium]
MSLYKHKYRIESARLKNWDYSTPSWYFVTINTKNKIKWFGEIVGDVIELNDFGKHVEQEWLYTAEMRKHIELDQYIIMPNHFHGIIIINESKEIKSFEKNVVETHRDASLRSIDKNKKYAINCLSNIIRGFKSSVTKWAHINGYCEFAWQPRFYDRIIRNEIELSRIRNYIKCNPLKW